MIGYKATDMNGCCRGFKFEVGKTYRKDTPKEEHKELLKLPNWDNEVFKEISGIDAEAEIAKESEVEK